MTFPIGAVRARFPALERPDAIYLDAPGGTQICRDAIDRMVGHLASGTANSGGAFATSRETDTLSEEAHAAAADLLGGRPEEIAFGPNMTTLTLGLSRALARTWSPGDEIVLTRLDHDANVAPWLLAARDAGATVRWLDFDPETGAWRLETLAALLSPRTRLVALGAASNALGTLNDLSAAVEIVRQHSDALIHVDAVQSVPHVATDVVALGCDFLACSPYKFFGPHQGLLWAREAVAARIDAYKVRPASIMPAAHRFETGTPSFEGQAGVLGTIDYLASLGGAAGTRRERIVAGFEAAHAYETALSDRFLAGLAAIEGVRLYGAPTSAGRVPTFGFTLAGRDPDAVAEALAARGIFAWSGHFYAVEVIARLGLAESGGLVRVGLCHYNMASEVDACLGALREIAAQ